mmetsp:Transcript_22316/g.48468  ORF Transcript_22316/g.48468 Transcript_22316/m.48468 type:complete len:91 (-) Transcript_22316:28-300(-)
MRCFHLHAPLQKACCSYSSFLWCIILRCVLGCSASIVAMLHGKDIERIKDGLSRQIRYDEWMDWIERLPPPMIIHSQFSTFPCKEPMQIP